MNNNFYDKDFRQQVKTNPRAVMPDIADNVEIKVVENTAETMHVVMPYVSPPEVPLESISAAGPWGAQGLNNDPQHQNNLNSGNRPPNAPVADINNNTTTATSPPPYRRPANTSGP